MGDHTLTQLLNSPFEVGIRVVAMLTAMYPASADLARIVLLDHAGLHSEAFAGGESLHPPTPGRVSELGVKRDLIRRGVQLMAARGLIVIQATPSGIYYRAGEDARPFLDSIDAPYLTQLRSRFAWVSTEFGPMSDDAVRARLNEVFGQWTEEFDQRNMRNKMTSGIDLIHLTVVGIDRERGYRRIWGAAHGDPRRVRPASHTSTSCLESRSACSQLEVPDEGKGYQYVHLGMRLDDTRTVTFIRDLAGGSIGVVDGDVRELLSTPAPEST